MAAEEIYGIYDSSPARPYDMKEVLARVVDLGRFDEYKPEYGKTLICGYARIGGFAVGIVANQKLHAQQVDHEGHKRLEFGGVIYTESAEKAARFIMDCNQNLISLVFFHDVNGFMSGDSAASTLVEIKIKQLERSGKKLSEEEKKELYESVKQTYDEQTDPRYGAARLWIDKIIDPVETREAIVQALEAAALNPDVAEFKVGVLQT